MVVPSLIKTRVDFVLQKGLGLIHINVSSLISEMDYISIWVLQTKADIFVFSETWHTDQVCDNDIALDGYNVLRTDRCQPTRGGGVAIFVKESFSVTIVNSVSVPKNFEYLALSVSLGNCEKLPLLGVYRPPSAPSAGISDLAHLISSHLSSEIILLGDLNLDWLSNTSDGRKDLCIDLNLTQLISAPTRPDPANLEKSTLLDLILTNKPHNFKASGVLPLDSSDHCPIACVRNVKQKN